MRRDKSRDPGYAAASHWSHAREQALARAAALALILSAIVLLSVPSGVRAAHWAPIWTPIWTWTCQAVSAGGGSSGDGATRKEAEDRALGNCAARSARFSECRIYKCNRIRAH